jgi:hypothetical protein
MEKPKGTSRYRKSKDRQHNGKTKEGNQIPLIKEQTRQPDTVNQRTDNTMEKPKGTTRYRKSKDPFGFSIVLSVL